LQELLQAGVSGYVLKQSAPTELICAIQAVASGKSYLDPKLLVKFSPAITKREINCAAKQAVNN
jgi:DNA-binding NarL/FixJ family response regulator